ncbi:MAG: MaoC family dehydratase [Solirubrobacterales bacterium]
MLSHTIDQINIGDTAYFEKTITEADVTLYAGLTGDFSYVHVNEERAKKTRFGRRIVHGMFLMGLISNVLGTQLPGHGTIYVSQEVKFLRPTFIGDTVRAQVEVIEIIREKGRVRLKTTCANQAGEQLLTGECVMIPPTVAEV